MIFTTYPIEWSDGDIDLLGVTDKNHEKQDIYQFDGILNQVHSVSQQWVNRNRRFQQESYV